MDLDFNFTNNSSIKSKNYMFVSHFRFKKSVILEKLKLRREPNLRYKRLNLLLEASFLFTSQ